MISEHYRELAKLDRSYWWFLVRHRIVRRLMLRALGRKPRSILDIGAGAGGFLSEMVEEGFIGRADVLALEHRDRERVMVYQFRLRLEGQVQKVARVKQSRRFALATDFQLLERELAALTPGRPGVTDLYFVGAAGYSGQDAVDYQEIFDFQAAADPVFPPLSGDARPSRARPDGSE